MKQQMKFAAATAAMVLSLGAANSAQAALTIAGACSVTDISPTADACSGWFDGNLLNASSIQDQKDALALLGFAWDGVWGPVDATKVNPEADGVTYDFAALLNGTTYIGIHKGKGGKNGFEGTGFFKLTANNVDTFKLNLQGGSSAAVYSTGISAVPEPATWAMMIIGFGAVGSMVRSVRRKDALAAA